MKDIQRVFFVIVLAFGLISVGCNKDDDDMPPPKTNPVAGFTFAANELAVTFTNTSTDAVSYSWNFGGW